MPNVNRETRALLLQVRAGKVVRSGGGCDVQRTSAGQNRRVERLLRPFKEAGWVELRGADQTYQLTALGDVGLDSAAAPATSPVQVRAGRVAAASRPQ